MNRYINLLLLLNVICCNADLSTKFKICSRSDPKLNDCLKVAIQSALAVLKDGFPDLNIPPLEPIRLSKYTVKGFEGVNYDQVYSNIELHEHVSSEIKEVNAVVDDEKFSLILKVYNPEVKFVADYEYKNAIMDGVDVSSKGKCISIATGWKSTVNFAGETRKNGDTEYIFLTNATITDSNVDVLKVIYESDNKEAAAKMTKFFKDNWEQVIKKSKDKFIVIYAEGYKNEANSIFARIPYNTLFPK